MTETGMAKRRRFRWEVDDWQLWVWRRTKMWDLRCELELNQQSLYFARGGFRWGTPVQSPLTSLSEETLRLNKNPTILKNVKVARGSMSVEGEGHIKKDNACQGLTFCTLQYTSSTLQVTAGPYNVQKCGIESRKVQQFSCGVVKF